MINPRCVEWKPQDQARNRLDQRLPAGTLLHEQTNDVKLMQGLSLFLFFVEIRLGLPHHPNLQHKQQN